MFLLVVQKLSDDTLLGLLLFLFLATAANCLTFIYLQMTDTNLVYSNSSLTEVETIVSNNLIETCFYLAYGKYIDKTNFIFSSL